MRLRYFQIGSDRIRTRVSASEAAGFSMAAEISISIAAKFTTLFDSRISSGGDSAAMRPTASSQSSAFALPAGRTTNWNRTT